MSDMINVLVIPAAARTYRELRTETIDNNDVDALQRLVGGYFELIRVPSVDGVLMWVNEDGMPLGLPANPVASALLGTLGAREGLVLGVPLLGDVVLTGERGEGAADVPADFVARLAGMMADTADPR